jgi:hypothetical protein
VPQYEDLVRRAAEAHARSVDLRLDAQRVRHLAALLREAHHSGVLLRYCAWCDRLEVGDEWLPLDGIGGGQLRLTAELRSRSTHGICPDCLARVTAEAAADRGARDRDTTCR